MRRWASALPRRSPPHQLCRRSSAAAQAAARRRPARAPQAATLPRGAPRAVVKGRGRRVRASGGRSKASQAGRAPPSWLAATWAQKAGELARGVAKAAGATCAPGGDRCARRKEFGGVSRTAARHAARTAWHAPRWGRAGLAAPLRHTCMAPPGASGRAISSARGRAGGENPLPPAGWCAATRHAARRARAQGRVAWRPLCMQVAAARPWAAQLPGLTDRLRSRTTTVVCRPAAAFGLCVPARARACHAAAATAPARPSAHLLHALRPQRSQRAAHTCASPLGR